LKQFEVESGTGKHKVYLFATVTQGGIMTVLVGGERPHLGAMVLSVPRQSQLNPGTVSCTSSVIPLTGHKDDKAAKPLAELLARKTSLPVSVSAGIHVDHASPEDIKKLKENSMDCGMKLLSLL